MGEDVFRQRRVMALLSTRLTSPNLSCCLQGRRWSHWKLRCYFTSFFLTGNKFLNLLRLGLPDASLNGPQGLSHLWSFWYQSTHTGGPLPSDDLRPTILVLCLGSS